VSERQPVVLIVAREGVVHKMLSTLLGDDCALLGARTPAAAIQIARQRPPDLVLLDDSFEDLEALVASLRERMQDLRVIVLATPNRPGTTVARLATIGPVVAKPFDNEQLRALVHDTLSLSALADAEHDADPPRVSRFITTKIQGPRKQAPAN
jgi:DNA-binding response OmpR family regulator